MTVELNRVVSTNIPRRLKPGAWDVLLGSYEREFMIDNLLVRIHFIIVVIR